MEEFLKQLKEQLGILKDITKSLDEKKRKDDEKIGLLGIVSHSGETLNEKIAQKDEKIAELELKIENYKIKEQFEMMKVNDRHLKTIEENSFEEQYMEQEKEIMNLKMQLKEKTAEIEKLKEREGSNQFFR